MSGHCLLKICKDVYLQSLIEEEELSFELREEIVYQYDGEPLNMLCISDANYGPEIGCAWYSVFELYSEDNRTYGPVASLGHSSRNYNHLPYRAKAQQILYAHLLEIRKAGKLRQTYNT